MDRKTEILELFKWNSWANEMYRGVLKEILFDDLRIDTPYGLLLDRIVHIFASFKMWHQRMKGQSPQKMISSDDFSNWEDLRSSWMEYEELIIHFIIGINDEDLDREVTYTSFDGKIYTRQIRHILLHLAMHPNYHRGQISAIFKFKDLPPLPSTDMVIYFLSK